MNVFFISITNTKFVYKIKCKGLVGPLIKKEDTVMRESFPPEQRLIATLTYLASGMSYQRLQFSTAISASSLCEIILETCATLFRV